MYLHHHYEYYPPLHHYTTGTCRRGAATGARVTRCLRLGYAPLSKSPIRRAAAQPFLPSDCIPTVGRPTLNPKP